MNWESVCRICLCSSKPLLDLYSNEDILKKISLLAQIQLQFKEAFPRSICQDCEENINKFHKFCLLIIESNKKLNNSQRAIKTEQLNEDDIFIEERPLETENVNSCDENYKKFIKESKKVLKSTVLFKCNECDKEFTHEGALKMHIKQDHIHKKIILEPSNSKVYKCDDCDKEFKHEGIFKIHKKYDHRKTNFAVCNICGLKLRKDNLGRHVKAHGESPVECKECGSILKNSVSLRSHLLRHRGERYTCEICGKVEKLKGELNMHMKIHKDPLFGRSVCPVCGKLVKKGIKIHMRTHTGEKPYPCTICGKAFRKNYGLKVHMRQHTGELPYACKLCPQAFRQKCSLLTHIKSKHSEPQKIDET